MDTATPLWPLSSAASELSPLLALPPPTPPPPPAHLRSLLLCPPGTPCRSHTQHRCTLRVLLSLAASPRVMRPSMSSSVLRRAGMQPSSSPVPLRSQPRFPSTATLPLSNLASPAVSSQPLPLSSLTASPSVQRSLPDVLLPLLRSSVRRLLPLRLWATGLPRVVRSVDVLHSHGLLPFASLQRRPHTSLSSQPRSTASTDGLPLCPPSRPVSLLCCSPPFPLTCTCTRPPSWR